MRRSSSNQRRRHSSLQKRHGGHRHADPSNALGSSDAAAGWGMSRKQKRGTYPPDKPQSRSKIGEKVKERRDSDRVDDKALAGPRPIGLECEESPEPRQRHRVQFECAPPLLDVAMPESTNLREVSPQLCPSEPSVGSTDPALLLGMDALSLRQSRSDVTGSSSCQSSLSPQAQAPATMAAYRATLAVFNHRRQHSVDSDSSAATTRTFVDNGTRSYAAVAGAARDATVGSASNSEVSTPTNSCGSLSFRPDVNFPDAPPPMVGNDSGGPLQLQSGLRGIPANGSMNNLLGSSFGSLGSSPSPHDSFRSVASSQDSISVRQTGLVGSGGSHAGQYMRAVQSARSYGLSIKDVLRRNRASTDERNRNSTAGVLNEEEY